MKTRIIEMETLNKHLPTIGSVLGQLLSEMQVEAGLEELTQNYYDMLIDLGIKFTMAIEYDEYDATSFEECLAMENVHDIYDAEPYVIPDELRRILRKKMRSTIDEYLGKQNENILIINRNTHEVRIDLLYKYCIDDIKKLYVEFVKKMYGDDKIESLPKEIIDVFLIEIGLGIDKIINTSIVRLLCYEEPRQNRDMCKDLEERGRKDLIKRYPYKLEIYYMEHLKDRIDEFLNNYLHKTMDTDKRKDGTSLFSTEMKRDALILTIGKVEMTIKDAKKYFMDNSTYQNCTGCIEVDELYRNMLSQSTDRVKNNSKLSKLLLALRQAKMNYLIKDEDDNEKFVYPFVFDLLVKSHAVLMKAAMYHEELISTVHLLNTMEETSDTLEEMSGTEAYLFAELKRFIRVIPHEYQRALTENPSNIKDFIDDLTVLVLKHYSSILEVEYRHIATVMRQLRFENPSANTSIYSMPKPFRSIDSLFANDDLRDLSLSVI